MDMALATVLTVVCAVAAPDRSGAAEKAAAGTGQARTAVKASSRASAGGAEQRPGGSATPLPPATVEEREALKTASDAYGRKEYERAAQILTPLARKGSARAAFSLGLMSMRGHGMPMSTETAEKWWKQAADGGFPEAQYQLGLMYHQGLRGARNPKAVAELWNKAAARGQGDAMYGLGYMYRAGDGVAKDPGRSAGMFADAAKLGHPGAMYELGMMYKYGAGGVSRDAAKGREWLQKAAAAGVSQARQELSRP